ncbi:MAG: S1C family serine protease [Opitutales bacterium]
MRLPSLLLCLAGIQLLSFARAEQTLPELFDRLNPTVVTIYTQKSVPAPFGQGFETKEQGLGSGVIIADTGKILTASHVVYDADDIEVELLNGQRVKAYIVAASRLADVALIQLMGNVQGLPHAPLGDSDQARIGESIFVIGAPYGLEHSLTRGIISQKTRQETKISGLISPEFIQTDAAINKGNSGGPMFNNDGEVIGIVSHIRSQSGGNEGLGFAVSIKTTSALVIESRNFYSGIDFQVLSGPLADAFNLGQPMGLLVERVTRGSPAARIKLQEGRIPVKIGNEELLIGGDVIVEMQGIVIDSTDAFSKILQTINELQTGDRFSLTVLRAGKRIELGATFFEK